MNLSAQSKEILQALWKLQNSLNQVVPPDLADYIIKLIAKDQSYQKLLNMVKEN